MRMEVNGSGGKGRERAAAQSDTMQNKEAIALIANANTMSAHFKYYTE